MRLALELVVIVVVIIIAAVVVITIFSRGIGPVADITSALSYCENIGSSSCKSVGSLPPTWNLAKIWEGKTCADLIKEHRGVDCKDCDSCKFPKAKQ